jgi:molecular chaperone Hsp33
MLGDMDYPIDQCADYVQPFQIDGLGINGRLVRLGPALQSVLSPHDYPDVVAELVGEAMAMAAAMASGLKFDGIFSLQMHGDGPVRLIVVDVTHSGYMRGYARTAEEANGELNADGNDKSIPRLMGTGRMAITVDHGPDMDRYQGITALEGATLGDCAHAYFRQSEQLNSVVRICARPATSDEPARAAALFLFRLPTAPQDEEDAEDNWRRTVALMSSVTLRELLDPDLSASRLLYRLFHDDGVRVFEQRPLRHQCRCSNDKIERLLHSFPDEDVRDMDEGGIISVVCEFCKATYTFETKDFMSPAAQDG